MPGLKQMSSTSSAGASVITLQFTSRSSIDIAEQEVQAAINAAGNLLPSDLPAPPIYAKVNPADAPILTLAVTSKTLPLTTVEDLADTRLAQKISQLPGVGLVSISGGTAPAVRIRANLQTLAAYGLNIDDLRTTIGNANIEPAQGQFRRPGAGLHDQRQRPARERRPVLRRGRRLQERRAGAAVRRRDRGRAPENTKLGAWSEHHAGRHPQHPAPARRQRHRGGRRRQGAPAASSPPRCPASIEWRSLTDRTDDDPRLGPRRRVRAHARRRAGRAGDLRLPAQHSAPRSSRASRCRSRSSARSAAMYLLGFSLNNLSLMSLTIATGFVVDDAIVMIENISRYVEKGDTPRARRRCRGSGRSASPSSRSPSR